jgi:molybdopterin synthase catalytic subunit
MANPVYHIVLTNEPLLAPPAQAESACGAVAEFSGIVRRAEGDREIEGIHYEAHADMAEHQMKKIAEEAAEKFRVTSVALHHRIGFVRVGEPSLWLRVMSRHRAAAFEASQWIVDELKKRVPIWKQPAFVERVPGQARVPKAMAVAK